MTEKILFFFSALGVFNALLFCVYFSMLKTSRKNYDYLLSFLLFMLVIRVGVSCFHFFGAIPNGLIKFGLLANLLVGPSVMWFLFASSHKDWKFKFNDLLIPGIFVLILIPSWVLFDFKIWDWRIRFVIHFLLTIYLLFCAARWRKEILVFFKGNNQSILLKKAMLIYVSLVAVCLGFAVSLFTSYVLGPLIFSLIFYANVALLYQINHKEKRNYNQKKIAQDEFDHINQKLVSLMKIEKLYRNPDLNLEGLAGKLGIGKHRLSQFLNDNLQKSFHQYVNDYRINEACQLLKENKPFSIEAIGHEVGFHSRSSFFSAFKKMKGMTPSKFKSEF